MTDKKDTILGMLKEMESAIQQMGQMNDAMKRFIESEGLGEKYQSFILQKNELPLQQEKARKIGQVR